MRIQKIGQNQPKQHFGTGVTKLYADFDGTYMPDEFSHNRVCNYNPPINKKSFQDYFRPLWILFGALKGNENEKKFNFVVTTGRNIAETNYFLNKLRSQDLWIPLPEKLVTCNGQDEYFLNVKDENEFYHSNKPAFVKENVNQEKREYYKSLGWDYDEIKSQLKEVLSKRQYEHKIKFQDRMQDFESAMFEQLSTCRRSFKDILNEIDAKELQKALEEEIARAKAREEYLAKKELREKESKEVKEGE